MSAGTGRLAGKAGLVTGGTSGLGRAVVLAMAREGASIVAMGRDAERGSDVVETVRAAGGTASFFQGDVTVEDDIVAAINHCRSEFGRFDIMHNNAGIVTSALPHEVTNEEWNRTLAVNLTAVFWGCKHAVIAMREEGRGGSIINTGSTSSFTATPDIVSYVATKHGVLGITKTVALAYASEGIRCNAMCPGDFESQVFEDFLAIEADPEAARRELEQLYPTKRILKPEDIAETAVFLASDASHPINGTHILIDDGILTKNY
jgi:NAD(P)-dependent dehydrogenase (short-subunit alcohol dehydrogenase family)